MKNHNGLILKISILGFFLCGCEDWLGGSEPKPPQPQEPVYKEYLEFKVNGVVWKPEVPFSITGSGPKWLASYDETKILNIAAFNRKREHDPIKYFSILHFIPLHLGLNHIPDSSIAPFIELQLDNGPTFGDTYISVPSSSSLFVSQLDTIKGRIACTFSTTLVNSSSDTLQITDGKFDLLVILKSN